MAVFACILRQALILLSRKFRAAFYICKVKNIWLRISVFLLAVLFLGGNLLSYPFYRFAIDEVKAEMKQEIFHVSPHQTVSFDLSLQDFKAVSDGNEMCMNGAWFDIVSSKQTGEKVNVVCLPDKKESMLKSWMDHVTKNESAPSSSKNNKQVKSISGDYFPSEINSLRLVPTAEQAAISLINLSTSGGHSSAPET